MSLLNKIALILLIIGYLVAGLNHFFNPQVYLPIIPAYIPLPHLMNVLAGGFEMLFSLLLIPAKTRRLAGIGIILMLIVFTTVHVDMVIHAPFLLTGKIEVSPLIAWLRLLLFQPLLILWAWWASKDKSLRSRKRR
jgi:uncharacterized membrane protein